MPGYTGFLSRLVLGVAVAMVGVSATADTAGAVPRKVKKMCRSDYKSLCPRYKVGTSKMRSCMRSKGGQLSWNCYQALKDAGYVRGSRKR